MSDENGQEPDMSDKEIEEANDYAIKNCLAKYVDPLDFVMYFMSCIDRKIIDDMASLIVSEARGHDSYSIAQIRISKVMYHALGKEVKHTHGI